MVGVANGKPPPGEDFLHWTLFYGSEALVSSLVPGTSSISLCWIVFRSDALKACFLPNKLTQQRSKARLSCSLVHDMYAAHRPLPQDV